MLDFINYGVNLTPHIEKYQNPDGDDTSDIMHQTWYFGNHLKARDYIIIYMHGPIGLYEGIPLKALPFRFQEKTEEGQIKEWCELFPKDRAYFLFGKTDDELFYDSVDKIIIREARAQRGIGKEPKRKKGKISFAFPKESEIEEETLSKKKPK